MTGEAPACGATGCGLVLVVDDDRAVRAGLVELVGRAGWDVREAADGESALALAADEPPAAVILDVRLPGISGWEVCRRLRASFGDGLGVLFISGERVEPMDRVAGLLLGGDDYLVKPFAPDELLVRLQNVLRRGPARQSGPALTRRELQVLQLLSEGKRQAEIASELVISPRTVGTHIEHILGKFGVHSRAEAVAMAFRDRLIAP